MLRTVNAQQPFYQLPRIVIVEHPRTGLLLTCGQDRLDHVRNAAGPQQDADQLPLVIGDCQLAKCAAASTDDHNDVATPNVDDLASHQPAAGENQHIVGQRW